MQVELLDHMGDDLDVVNAARVSFAKFKEEMDAADEKLIRYLAREDHWSPFAHTSVKFRVRAPIFVARQLAKHQIGAAWNEESRRYIDDAPEFYYPKEWRGRPKNVKQGSGEAIHPGDGFLADSTYETAMHDSLKAYHSLLKRGVAPEMARSVLPQSTYTSWIWTGSLFFFARVCKLRIDPHAQQETMWVAKQIYGECEKIFPVSWRFLFSTKSGGVK